MKEEELQIAISDYLKSLTEYELKDRFCFMHIPNESGFRATPGWYAKRKRMGLLAGTPDLLLMFRYAKIYWIELKVDRLKTKDANAIDLLSEKQKDFRVMVKRLGFNHAVLACKTIKDGINGIKRIIKSQVGEF